MKNQSLTVLLSAALAGAIGCSNTEKTELVSVAQHCDERAHHLSTADTPAKAAYLGDLKKLQHDLEHSEGHLYIFINGYLSPDGKIVKGFWAYQTNVTPKDLAAILSKHTGIAPPDSRPIPAYFEPEDVVRMASHAKSAYQQPPTGKTISLIDADKAGYVPVQLHTIGDLLNDNTRCGGGTFTQVEPSSGGRTFTSENHEQMQRYDYKQGVYDKQVPALMHLVITPPAKQ